MIRFLYLLLIFPLSSFAQQVGVGQWRDHLSYYNAFTVDFGGDKVFAASQQGLLIHDLTDNNTSKFSKVDGLSDVGLTAIKYDEARSTLIVGYNNGNIDFLKNGAVINMPDIKRTNIVGDKTVRNILVKDKFGYLSCGFGIVVFNLDKLEVTDTWKFTPTGTAIQINDLAILGDSIYATTPVGIYKADLKNKFLNDFGNWTSVTTLPFQASNFTEIEVFDGKVYVQCKPSGSAEKILTYNGGSWSVLNGLPDPVYSDIHACEDRIVFSGNYSCSFIPKNSSEISSFYKPILNKLDFSPQEAGFYKGYYYIAERHQGLLQTSDGKSYANFTPNGPLTNSTFRVSAEGGKTYIATGGKKDDAFTAAYRQDGIPIFDGKYWQTPDENTDSGLVNTYDYLDIAIDPKNPNHAFVSTNGAGIVEIVDGKAIKTYDDKNSSVQTIPGYPGYWRVNASEFDEDGNLWAVNSKVPNNLLLRKSSGDWSSYKLPSDFGRSTSTTILDLLITQDKTKWMVRKGEQGGFGIYAYNDNGTLDNTEDDSHRSLTITANDGGLPSNEVYSIAEDLDGEIWLGSDKGFAIIYNPSAALSGSAVNADQPIIQQDGNYEKILETEAISSIAVDGGNRKWLATQNSGVYLLNADGTKQILHFSAENSPLFSNEVYSVTIDQSTGEVFFGTSVGVQSYLSDATGPSEKIKDVTIFPNPVRPDYSGPVAIRGLVRNTNVKVTDIAGNIVFQTTSQGGQAIWNGKNFNGARVATGVYLVFCTNEDGSETGVGKIIFVN